jgi:ferredoxin
MCDGRRPDEIGDLTDARFGWCAMTAGKRVRVDPRLCEGHALCIDTAPEVFELTHSDVATCLENPPRELSEQIRAAVDACPRGAITVVED